MMNLNSSADALTAGLIALLAGSAQATTPTFEVLHTFHGQSLGVSICDHGCGVGDVNGDGYDDYILKEDGDDSNGEGIGKVRVLSGFDDSTIYTFNDGSADDWFAVSVSGAGDVNKDGYADIIVGAPLDDNNGRNSGSAFLYSGIDGSLLGVFYGLASGDLFGFSLLGVGDVSCDGIDDFIVSSRGGSLKNGGYVVVYAGIDGPCLSAYDCAGDRTVEMFDLLDYLNTLTGSETSTHVLDYISGFKACAD